MDATSEEQAEFASTRFWKSPNTIDAEVPPAGAPDSADNVKRIHDFATPPETAPPDTAT